MSQYRKELEQSLIYLDKDSEKRLYEISTLVSDASPTNASSSYAISENDLHVNGQVESKVQTTKIQFPIVCVGGSAGGLDAYIKLLEHLPSDMGIAIVFVNHIRTRPTILHEILGKYTTMPVNLITDNLDIKTNHVYVIPPNRDLHILNGVFKLRPMSKVVGWPDVITIFLRSLIHSCDGKLIAVIVSGYDSDGSAALCGIKEVGGFTIAQKLSTAIQQDMPESAIQSGCIDFVLAPEDIAKKIVEIMS